MKKLDKKQIGAILMVVSLIGFWLAPVIPGLNKDAMMFLGVFVSAMISLAVGVLSTEITMILSLVVLVLIGTADFATAFKNFSGTTVWMLIGVFGFGTAVSNSGLMTRIALHVMKLFPQTYNGRLLAVMTAGSIMSPLIPNISAKAVVMCPAAISMAKEAGYAPRSKGMVGLFMAGYISSGISGNAFMTGSLAVPLVLMFLPEPLSWTEWFLACIVWFVVITVGMYLYLRFNYDPKEDTPVEEQTVEGKSSAIEQRLAELGSLSKKELLVAAVLVVCMGLWMTETVHGIPSVMITLGAFCLLAIAGLFNTLDFMTKIAWPVVVMCGAMTGLTDIMAAVGITAWISEFIGPVILKFASNPYVLVAVVCVLSGGLWMVFINFITTMAVISAVFTPIAATVGIHPFVPLFCAMISAQMWIWQPQSTSVLAALGVAGDNVLHEDTIKTSVAWIVVCFIACMASVPVWQLLGMA